MDKDFARARLVVDKVFYPKLEKNIEHLNEHLAKECGIRVGMEINWFFEKIDAEV